MCRSRIKLKPLDKTSIYDIFIIKMLRDTDTSNELYIYVDDRTISPQDTQKMIDDTINIFRLFDIKMPDTIIRYSDYYETAWIYLHRLITLNKAVLNYSTTSKPTDLYTMAKTKNIKIFYNNIEQQNNIRYDNILYDCGWFRDVFIETLIDYSERIDKIVDDEDKGGFLSCLCKDLKFTLPERLFTNLVSTIKHNKSLKGGKPLCLSLSLSLSEVPVEYVHRLGIDIDSIHGMIERNDDSLLSCATKLVDNLEELIELVDPVRIMFDKTKDVELEGLGKRCIKGVYVNSSDLSNLSNLSNLQEGKVVRIRSVGCVTIDTGVTCKSKKYKNVPVIAKWYPIQDDTSFVCNVYDQNNVKIKTIITSTSILTNPNPNPNPKGSNKLYSIKSELYVVNDSIPTCSDTLDLIPWDVWLLKQSKN